MARVVATCTLDHKTKRKSDESNSFQEYHTIRSNEIDSARTVCVCTGTT